MIILWFQLFYTVLTILVESNAVSSTVKERDQTDNASLSIVIQIKKFQKAFKTKVFVCSVFAFIV